jgi:hypothetical protein
MSLLSLLLRRIRPLPWFLLMLYLSGCSAPYHFRYHYTQVAPPGGLTGVEDDQVRLQLSPVPAGGMMQLTITNKYTEPIVLIWEQTYYLDPSGRRQSVAESGMTWFHPSQWFSDDTRIAPGDSLRLQVHPGAPQSYNPLSWARTASGQLAVSSTPQPLLPTAGKTRAVGESYQNQEFHFILTLRIGANTVPYPFTFRITDVEVKKMD